MPRKLTAFHIDPDQLVALQQIKRLEDVPIAAQIRRGIDLWLQQRGVKKAELQQPPNTDCP